MANLEVQIKPNGLSQRNLVDLLYMIVAALKGICTKMDADGQVTLTTYVANCYTAIFNGYIEDSKGNILINRVTAQDRFFYHVDPCGIDTKEVNEFLYQIFNMMKTLSTQCDTDALTDNNYQALVYTALYLWMVTNQAGNTLGNGNTYWFNPGGSFDQKNLVNCLAAIVNSINVLCLKLDLDGTVQDTDYTALWFTATILMQIQNTSGTIYGNALTKYMP